MTYHLNTRRGRYYLWYRGRWMAKGVEEALRTTDKRVAERRAQARVQEVEHEHEGIIAPKDQRVAGQQSLTTQVDAYIAALKGDNRDRKYIANTRVRLHRLRTECGWQRLIDVTPDSFVTWRNGASSRRTSLPLAPRTKQQFQEHLHAFFKWLREVGRVGHNPFTDLRRVDARRKDEEDKRAFADSELVRLFKLDVPQAAIYYLAYASGLRWAELRELTWGQINVDAAEPFWLQRWTTTCAPLLTLRTPSQRNSATAPSASPASRVGG